MHETEYDLTHHGDSFFIRTNDGAKTFRVVEAPVNDPSKANWKEVLPARPAVTIESVTSFKDHLVLRSAITGLIQDPHPKFRAVKTHYIDFPEPVYTAGLGANAEFDTKLLRFNYTSLVTPNSVFDYNMETRIARIEKTAAGARRLRSLEVPFGADLRHGSGRR